MGVQKPETSEACYMLLCSLQVIYGSMDGVPLDFPTSAELLPEQPIFSALSEEFSARNPLLCPWNRKSQQN